ncbi:chromosomal replication initiator protein DnaA [Candidatus Fermentibacterales bacterium]|nr:chromosomal replication initiator protein DnaA [Candidatus Fermentibacterales bacterium]
MAETDYRQLWRQCLTAARDRVPTSTFNSWLADSEFDSADGDVVYVRFPNEFMAKWARGHYGDLLEDLLRVVSGNSRISLRCIGDPAEVSAPAPPPVTRQPPARDYLHPGYTFERFVPGRNNELAHAGALSVAREFGHSRYNPLFIYGGVGLGKTHLTQAIGHFVRQHFAGCTYRYISSERFTQDLINAIGGHATYEFRRDYLNVDLLLMDDVHFMAGKERTQEEFFYRFNELYQNGKQIVLTSDRPPVEIPDLEERLVSRFQSGLVADIQPPEFETRVAILSQKATEAGFRFRLEVLELIASVIKDNVRQLEGAVNRLSASANADGSSLTPDEAKLLLADYLPDLSRIISTGSVLAAVAEDFQVAPSLIRGKQRRREVLLPRQVAMYLMRELTETSLVEIGRVFSGRDHSTVLHSTERIRHLMDEDPILKRRVQDLAKRLRS